MVHAHADMLRRRERISVHAAHVTTVKKENSLATGLGEFFPEAEDE